MSETFSKWNELGGFTPDDALLVRNTSILGYYIEIISQFVKPSSDTLLRYFNMFHLAPSPSSLQF
jgi:hypothetical protein